MTVDTYAAMADRRPRVKQDVLYTQTSAGVLFHNTRGGFQLTAGGGYRLACALVPRLTGRRTVSELCSGLPAPMRSVVGELVSKLLDFGFARDVADDDEAAAACPPAVAAAFAAQLAYIDHYVGPPYARFLRFRDSRVAVLGGGEVARTCALGLIRNGAGHVGTDSALMSDAEVSHELARLAEAGCPVDTLDIDPCFGTGADPWAALAGYDAVVVADASGEAGRRLLTLLQAGVPAGVRLLPAGQIGDRVVVGPLVVADGGPGRDGGAPCWGCALLRLSTNDAAGTAELWTRMTMPSIPAPPPPSRPLAAMIGNLLAFETFRTFTGALPPETDGTVVVQNLDTLDLVTETIVKDPRCAFHPAAEDPTVGLAGLLPASAPVSTASDADDADPLLAALSDTALLVRPTVGVFTGFADEPITQLPLKASRVRMGAGAGRERVIAAFDVHHTAAARFAAMHRAAQVYAEHLVPGSACASAPDAEDCVDPGRLDVADGGPGRPERRWQRAVSMTTGVCRWVPAGAVRPYGADNPDGAYLATSAGRGAGRTAAEALGRGLLSALGFHALRGAMGGTVKALTVPVLALADDRELDFLVRSAVGYGLDVELLLLEEPAPHRSTAARTVLARAHDRERDVPVWALGTEVTGQRALLTALRDLVGQVQLTRDGDPEVRGTALDLGDDLLRGFEPGTLVAAGPAQPPVVAGLLSGEGAGWDEVLAALPGRGLDALAVATSGPELAWAGVATVRVLLVAEA